MFIRTAAFPLLLLCLARAGESPNAERETVSNELVPDAARAPSCDPASEELTLPEGFFATVFAEDLGLPVPRSKPKSVYCPTETYRTKGKGDGQGQGNLGVRH